MITLAPLNWSDGHTVAHLAPYPDQIPFAGTVEEILREPPERFDLHQILEHGEPVGVFKIDREFDTSFPVAPDAQLGLRALIIDAGAQGRGIGTAAMRALPGHLAPLYPTSTYVYLTVNFSNLAALAAYTKAGFENTGNIWPHGSAGPQAVMRYRLRDA